MPRKPARYQEGVPLLPYVKSRLAYALREVWREGYESSDLRADLLAGTVVALVAIPLSMALAIASGVPPQSGLYTAMIAGLCVALLGGSRLQVTGPTAAFVVILAPIAQKYGYSGLLVSGLMAGFFLVAMGVGRLGRYIEFIPYPVTTGFTAGIAVVIATIQLKDFFGLQLTASPESYVDRVKLLLAARGTFSPAEFLVGVSTLAMLVLWPKINRKIPAPLVALGVITLATVVAGRIWPQVSIATIGSRFAFVAPSGEIGHGIPGFLPRFAWPWKLPGAGESHLVIDFHTIETLWPSAMAIALLGAIESLLSAVVADAMARTKHDPDAELVALGLGNLLCPFFGGIAATGAIARTATNFRFGARSPLAAAFHAVVVVVVVLLLSSVVSLLPMAALAALLLLVAYNMFEIKNFAHLLRIAPRSDVTVLLICFGLTVLFDMVIGVTVGVVLATLLFMRRMATLTSGQILDQAAHAQWHGQVPHDVVLYEIAGPLFFGAAKNAVETLSAITDDIRTIVFILDRVPVMDFTGLVAFETTIRNLSMAKKKVYLVGLNDQPRELIERSGLLTDEGVEVCRSLKQVLTRLGSK